MHRTLLSVCRALGRLLGQRVQTTKVAWRGGASELLLQRWRTTQLGGKPKLLVPLASPLAELARHLFQQRQ